MRNRRLHCVMIVLPSELAMAALNPRLGSFVFSHRPLSEYSDIVYPRVLTRCTTCPFPENETAEHVRISFKTSLFGNFHQTAAKMVHA